MTLMCGSVIVGHALYYLYLNRKVSYLRLALELCREFKVVFAETFSCPDSAG